MPSIRAHDLALSVLLWTSPTRFILVAPGAPGPPRQLTDFGGRVNAGNAVPEVAKTGRNLLVCPGDGHQPSQPRRGPSTGLTGPPKIWTTLGPTGAHSRGLAGYLPCPGPSPECPLVDRSNQDQIGGSCCPWAATGVDGVWRPGERRQRRPRGCQDREEPDGVSW